MYLPSAGTVDFDTGAITSLQTVHTDGIWFETNLKISLPCHIVIFSSRPKWNFVSKSSPFDGIRECQPCLLSKIFCSVHNFSSRAFERRFEKFKKSAECYVSS